MNRCFRLITSGIEWSMRTKVSDLSKLSVWGTQATSATALGAQGFLASRSSCALTDRMLRNVSNDCFGEAATQRLDILPTASVGARVFWRFLRSFLSVLSSVRPVYVLALPPLALPLIAASSDCRAVDEFRERGSNWLIDLRGPLPFPECPCSWLT